MQAKPFTLVLVEDDDVDAETVERCLAQGRIANPLVRARDGIEALEMLRGTNGRSRLQPPYLFLVDIRMPRLDGIGFMQDPLEYGTRTHHSNMDLYDRVQPGDVMQGAMIEAWFAYNAATRPDMLPRIETPAPTAK